MASSVSCTAETKTLLRETRREISLEWDIMKFCDLCDDVNSDKFCFAEDYFHFCFNPVSSVYIGCAVVYIVKESFRSKRNINYLIGIKDNRDSVFKSKTGTWLAYDENGVHALPFCKSELAENEDVIATNGSLMVFFDAYLVKNIKQDAASQITSVADNSRMTLSQDFKKLFWAGNHGDITIRVQNREFSAHKAVLAARSSVFSTMLEVDMVENNEGVINMDDCDADCLKSFLLYIYSGDSNVVSSSNALDLYFVADKYNVKELRKACSQLLARELTVDTICDVVKLASLYDESELLAAATEYFIDNGDTVVSTPNWLSFFAENPTVGNELILKLVKRYKK